MNRSAGNLTRRLGWLCVLCLVVASSLVVAGPAQADPPPASATSGAPVIDLEPVSATILTTGAATFNVDATGLVAPSVEWNTSIDGGTTWTSLNEETLSIVVSGASAQDGSLYQAVLTNSFGSTTSSAATLNVLTGSSLWSGYVSAGATDQFSSASAKWVVPKIDCSSKRAGWSSQWVGIGSSTVEQTGVDYDCAPGSSTPGYVAWYEVFDSRLRADGPEVYAPAKGHLIEAGNTIAASVRFVSTNWRFRITNLSRHWSFVGVVPGFSPPADQSSAEFIVEAAAPHTKGYPPLSNFGHTTFQDCSVTSDGVVEPFSSLPIQGLAMTLGQRILTQPGPLATSNSSFSVTMITNY